MARANFDDALTRLLAHEGGYTNHPSDPGGPTNFGITIGDYRRYVKPAATAADVRAMRVDDAKAIYRSRYWNAMRCDELPAGLDYAVFDYGVNSGVARAAKVLQRLLGVSDDGHTSDALVAAVAKHDASDLIARLCDERLAFLKGLKTWPVFGVGWGRRVGEVRAAALVMAAKAKAAPTPQSSPARQTVARTNTPFRTAVAATIAALGAAAAHLSSIQLTKETSMSVIVLILAVAGGYAVSAITRPRLRQALIGIESEIEDLRTRARALETKLRG